MIPRTLHHLLLDNRKYLIQNRINGFDRICFSTLSADSNNTTTSLLETSEKQKPMEEEKKENNTNIIIGGYVKIKHGEEEFPRKLVDTEFFKVF